MFFKLKCSSFLTALDIASHYIELDTYKNILIVSCDICSRGLNENNVSIASGVVPTNQYTMQVPDTPVQQVDNNVFVPDMNNNVVATDNTEVQNNGTFLPGIATNTGVVPNNNVQMVDQNTTIVDPNQNMGITVETSVNQ